MTFLVMYLFGIDLQRISLGALIISLGLLVDDAIIAVEMMALKMEQGWDKFRAATYAYTSTAFPMLTGTLITAAGFLPVGFAKSGAGEYTFSIFPVVGISLDVSWIVAVVFTPYLGFKLLQGAGARIARRGRGLPARLLPRVPALRRFVPGAPWLGDRHHAGRLRRSLVLFKAVPQQFFPASDRPELMVDLWLPKAATFEASQREVKAARSPAQGRSGRRGCHQLRRQRHPALLPAAGRADAQPEPRRVDGDDQGRAKRASACWPRSTSCSTTDFPRARPRQSAGERPAGRLSGAVPGLRPRQQQVARIADQVAEILRADPHMRRVNLDWNERVKRVQVDIDQDKARALGISSSRSSRRSRPRCPARRSPSTARATRASTWSRAWSRRSAPT